MKLEGGVRDKRHNVFHDSQLEGVPVETEISSDDFERVCT